MKKIRNCLLLALLSCVFLGIFGVVGCNLGSGGKMPYDGTYSATSAFSGYDIVIDKGGYIYGEDRGKVVNGVGGLEMEDYPYKFYQDNRVIAGIQLKFSDFEVDFYTENRVSLSARLYSGNSVSNSLSLGINGTYTYVDTSNIYMSSSGSYSFKNGLLLLDGVKVPALQSLYISTDKKLYSGVWIKDYGGFLNEPTLAEYSQFCVVNLNNLSDGNYSFKQAVGSTYTLYEPEKAGYKFMGWETDCNVTNNSVVVNGDVSFTAKWEIIDYTITLNWGDEQYAYFINYGDEGYLPVPEVKGYNFLGWSLNGEPFTDSDGALLMPFNKTEDVKLDPAFALIEYYAYYRAWVFGQTYSDCCLQSGGKSDVSFEFTVSAETDFSAPEITAVAADGFRFIGWDDGITSATRCDTDLEVGQRLEATAYFVKSCTVTFACATGGGHIEGNLVQTVDDYSPATEVVAVPDEGYEFVAWTEVPSGYENYYAYSNNAAITVTPNDLKDKNLYAIFRPIRNNG